MLILPVQVVQVAQVMQTGARLVRFAPLARLAKSCPQTAELISQHVVVVVVEEVVVEMHGANGYNITVLAALLRVGVECSAFLEMAGLGQYGPSNCTPQLEHRIRIKPRCFGDPCRVVGASDSRWCRKRGKDWGLMFMVATLRVQRTQ